MKFRYDKEYIYLQEDNKVLGYIYYQKRMEQVIDVISTYVYDEYRGQGIAGILFDELVSFARSHHYHIIPSCSYIKKKLENSSKYDDIYDKGESFL